MVSLLCVTEHCLFENGSWEPGNERWQEHTVGLSLCHGSTLGLTVYLQSHRAQRHFNQRCRWMDVIGSPRNRCHYTRCPSAWRLARLREGTWAHSEGVIYVSTELNKAIGFSRECRIMRPSSCRLIWQAT
ncbi:hypothetical protein TNCV_2832421 [Trichonephila clavipes]|nr:hypothetical protein TNCV_2832421 [Trichonephila clavipes]